MKIFLIHILFITPGICFDPHIVTDISHWLDNGKTCFGEDYASNDDSYYYDDDESELIPRSWPTRVSPQNPIADFGKSESCSSWLAWGQWTRCNEQLTRFRQRGCRDSKDLDKKEEKCQIDGINQPDFCSNFNHPNPRILLLGGTGVGKSTLGNLLLGVNSRCRGRNETTKECTGRDIYKIGHLLPETEKLPFMPGAGIDSKTLETNLFSGQYLGTGPCITLIDTPGAGDTKGRDFEHAVKIANTLKNELGSFDAILLMFKGTDIRFSTHTIALLKLYQNIFGKEMWKNVIVEISYWKHTERKACDRISNKDGLDEEKLAAALNAKFHSEFGISFSVPLVFIYPVIQIFNPEESSTMEQREKDIFHNQTTELFNLVSLKSKHPYMCSENCKAPNKFYLGHPWIKEIPHAVDGSTNFVTTCKIWDGIVSSAHKNSDGMKWYFNNELLSYSQSQNSSNMVINPPYMEPGTLFSISTIQIKKVDARKHQGTYRCENSKGNSTFFLNIPHWTDWGPWTPCTQTCRNYPGGRPGKRKRIRKCQTTVSSEGCQSIAEVEENCTGDAGQKDVFCPIPPKVTEWTAWSGCSDTCGYGKQQRTRTCKEGMFGVSREDDKCPTYQNKAYEIETFPCSIGSSIRCSDSGGHLPVDSTNPPELNFLPKQLKEIYKFIRNFKFQTTGPVLLHSGSDYKYYKVPVSNGTRLTEGQVAKTCERMWLKAVCSGPSHCKYSSNRCIVTPLSTNCNNPLYPLSKLLCSGGKPLNCPQFEGVFSYMSNWVGGECGRVGSGWCARGDDFVPGVKVYYAYCAREI